MLGVCGLGSNVGGDVGCYSFDFNFNFNVDGNVDVDCFVIVFLVDGNVYIYLDVVVSVGRVV